MAPLHQIAGDPDVVGGGGPRQANLTGAQCGRCQPRGGRRWRRIWCGGGRAGDVRVRAEIARSVRCPHAIAVAGGGRQTRVGKGRTRGRADLDKIAASRPLAPLDLISDCARRRGPGQVDLAAVDRRGCEVRGCSQRHRAEHTELGLGSYVHLPVRDGRCIELDTARQLVAGDHVTIVQLLRQIEGVVSVEHRRRSVDVSVNLNRPHDSVAGPVRRDAWGCPRKSEGGRRL